MFSQDCNGAETGNDDKVKTPIYVPQHNVLPGLNDPSAEAHT